MNEIVDGMLLYGSGPKIYLIVDGEKCHITSMAEFKILVLHQGLLK